MFGDHMLRLCKAINVVWLRSMVAKPVPQQDEEEVYDDGPAEPVRPRPYRMPGLPTCVTLTFWYYIFTDEESYSHRMKM